MTGTVKCELWGGPACGVEISLSLDPSGSMPVLDTYYMPLAADHKPILDLSKVKAESTAVYERSLPRHGRWMYVFKRLARP